MRFAFLESNINHGENTVEDPLKTIYWVGVSSDKRCIGPGSLSSPISATIFPFLSKRYSVMPPQLCS